jgi:2-amino-4-hydroxy-6-hydroxymethyldihydropteridine diphosphokinase
VERVSTVWESHAVGTEGPNFLNACVLLLCASTTAELKVEILHPIEAALGRVRSEDKNASRTIDLDIVMTDEKPVNLERWNFAFVVVPMAELVPNLLHPLTHEKLSLAAERMRAETWMLERPEIWITADKNAPR